MPTDANIGSANGQPHLDAVDPLFALPGGEVRITGSHLRPAELRQPRVSFSDVPGSVVISSDKFLIARVPEGAASGGVIVSANNADSNALNVGVAEVIGENLHPVSNPAVDDEGNVYATVSGSRGQKVPIAIYKIDPDENLKPFVVDLMNATGLTVDNDGILYVSSRYDGTVYQVTHNGNVSTYAEGMGVATGIAFDANHNLYVGDRSGTIFKISNDRQMYVFATLEPSVSAYHLAFGPNDSLFVTGPTTSSYDAVYEIDTHGTVSVFYRGLGRPQGLAFDDAENLYVAASLGGKRGIVRITPDRQASLVVSGNNLIGLAFAPNRSVILATTSALYRLAWNIHGRPLFG